MGRPDRIEREALRQEILRIKTELPHAGGRLFWEQAGAPAEIYERPASRFVARFIGAANFLDGTLGNGIPGRTAIATSLGTLIVEKVSNGLAIGDRVAVLLRPEAIRLGPPDGPAEPNRLLGTIAHAMYTGAVIRYTVEVGDTLLLKNNDSSTQFVAGYPVSPHQTLKIPLNRAGTYQTSCSVHRDRTIRMVITS